MRNNNKNPNELKNILIFIVIDKDIKIPMIINTNNEFSASD